MMSQSEPELDKAALYLTDPQLRPVVHLLLSLLGFHSRTQRLVERDCQPIAHSEPTLDSPELEVLFQIEMGGVRYLLLRANRGGEDGLEVKELSPRELEIVHLISKGLPNKAIASILEISPWTVATHLRRIYGKLGVNSRAEMVAIMLKKLNWHA